MQEAVPLIEIGIKDAQENEIVGLVSCACWNYHATISKQKCGFLMVLMVFFIGAGLLFPYLTTVIRKFMPAFIPFISQAGGQPPSNGVFAIFMTIGTFFGIFSFVLLYVTIRQRNVHQLKVIRICNNICISVLGICGLGLIVTVQNPVGYTDVPNKFEWVTTVLFEHSFGAIMILAGVAISQYVLTVIWWFLPDTSRKETYVKLAFDIVYFIFFLIIIYPMPMYIIEELGPNPFDFAAMKNVTYDLPVKFSINYKLCAFCEYALCILGLVNFMMHYKDLQKVSLHLVLRHKSCLDETVEPPGPSLSLKVIK